MLAPALTDVFEPALVNETPEMSHGIARLGRSLVQCELFELPFRSALLDLPDQSVDRICQVSLTPAPEHRGVLLKLRGKAVEPSLGHGWLLTCDPAYGIRKAESPRLSDEPDSVSPRSTRVAVAQILLGV